MSGNGYRPFQPLQSSHHIVPTENDVLSGRGVNIAQHPGNLRFRALVTVRADSSYCSTYTASEKKAVASEIIQHIRSLNPPGRFLKRDGRGQVSRGLSGPWEELSEKEVFKKTCQALRDCNRTDRDGYAERVPLPEDVQANARQRQMSGLTGKEHASRAAAESAATGAGSIQKRDWGRVSPSVENAAEWLKKQRTEDSGTPTNVTPSTNATTATELMNHGGSNTPYVPHDPSVAYEPFPAPASRSSGSAPAGGALVYGLTHGYAPSTAHQQPASSPVSQPSTGIYYQLQQPNSTSYESGSTSTGHFAPAPPSVVYPPMVAVDYSSASPTTTATNSRAPSQGAAPAPGSFETSAAPPPMSSQGHNTDGFFDLEGSLSYQQPAPSPSAVGAYTHMFAPTPAYNQQRALTTAPAPAPAYAAAPSNHATPGHYNQAPTSDGPTHQTPHGQQLKEYSGASWLSAPEYHSAIAEYQAMSPNADPSNLTDSSYDHGDLLDASAGADLLISAASLSTGAEALVEAAVVAAKWESEMGFDT